MSKDFVHLHVHTEYSIQDAMSKITPLMKRAAELGQKAMAITDHGNMFGVIDFFKKAKKHGIKPIIGCEMYICPQGKEAKVRDNRHIVLLAKNQIGYFNLMQIITEATVDGGFYYNPRTDYDSLKKYHEGLICLTACLGGDIPKTIETEGYDKGKEKLLLYVDIFGKENLFLEVQDNGLAEQHILNQHLIRMSAETGVELVATNDVHYVTNKDSYYHDMLMAIQAKTTIYNDKRKKYESNEFYLKSYDEMNRGDIPISALDNTNKIADMCNFEFDFSAMHIPRFDDTPKDFLSNYDYLRYLAYKGMDERFEGVYGIDKEFTKAHDERLEYELSVIQKMGYIDYFLIVWNFEHFCQRENMFTAPGRGSAAGSLLSYALYITDIDPIPHGYIFERFLNPSRVSLPDIDYDVQSDRRGELIDYVIDKYGRDAVCQIIAIGTYAARAAVRAVGRALDIPYMVCDKIAKMIPKIPDITIKEAMSENPSFGELYANDKESRDIIDAAIAIEGLPSNLTTHAAGVLITPESVRKYVPLWKNKDAIVTQFDMNFLEELGLLKMDFLGLKTLGVIKMALKNIEKNYGIKISKDDLLNILDNSEPYELISKGFTQGIFQFEGAGITSAAKELRPANLEELTALNALYRPGPMDNIPQYIYNKNHQNEIVYPFSGDAKEILEETYGVLCYQEQVMRLAQKIAGYSMANADVLRKAIGKKKAELIQEHREYFIHGKLDDADNVLIAGGVRNGYNEKELAEYYDNIIVPFGRYAFNKPHAGCYALIAAISAYLKYHYPEEFMSALLTFNFDSKDKIPIYIRHCKVDLNINIINPNINISNSEFVPLTDHSIAFGLSALKGVGRNTVNDIVAEREKGGLFSSFTDFVERMIGYNSLNRTVCESLIQAGSFDFSAKTRTQLIYALDEIKDLAGQFKTSWNNGQLPLFIQPRPKEDYNLPDIKEYPEKILLKVEKEVSNIYISGHPLDRVNWYISKHQTITSRDLEITEEEDDDFKEDEEGLKELPDRVSLYDQKPVDIICMMTELRTLKTKKGDIMAFMNVEDQSGFTSITLFPYIYEKYKQLFTEDKILHISGVLNFYNGEYKIVANYVKEVSEEQLKYLYIEVENVSEASSLIQFLVDSNGSYIPKIVRGKWSVLLPKEYWASEKTVETLKYLNYKVKLIES